LRHDVVSVSGSCPAISSASSPATVRTVSESGPRRSGATTWMPREPDVIAYGAKPCERSRSPSASAPSRIASKCPSASSAGSKSKTIRSGWSGLSARAVQLCGVMQFWFASQTSVAFSPPTTLVISPPFRRDTVTRRTHSGAPFGIACWTTTSLSIPSFQRHRFSGRSRTWPVITSPTAA
jgi:hypothetical protein